MENKKYINTEYPNSKLTSELIRFSYDVYDELGYGLAEKIYQRAFESLLKKNGLKYSKEKFGRIVFDGNVIGKYFVDFVVENIAVEFKIRNEIYQKDVSQLLNYIKSENLQTVLVIALGKSGIKI